MHIMVKLCKVNLVKQMNDDPRKYVIFTKLTKMT